MSASLKAKVNRGSLEKNENCKTSFYLASLGLVFSAVLITSSVDLTAAVLQYSNTLVLHVENNPLGNGLHSGHVSVVVKANANRVWLLFRPEGLVSVKSW